VPVEYRRDFRRDFRQYCGNIFATFDALPRRRNRLSMKTVPSSPLSDPAPAVNAEQAEFMQSGVSINAGSCSADLIPNVVRALGCKVSPDDGRVRILLSTEKSAAFLKDIRANGKIAVTFVQPSTHRSMQVKGSDASIIEASPEDREIIGRLCESFMAELRPLGYDPAIVNAVMDCPSDIVAVVFTAAAAFQQTPGPRAGEPLKAGT
jgi:hypothetical protein